MAKESDVGRVVSQIKSKHRIFVQGAAATPHVLLKALVDRAEDLQGVELVHLHLEGEIFHGNPSLRKNFRVTNLFVGSNMRKDLNYDENDYLPCFLSEIPNLFRSGRRPIDVALIHVSPPDRHGYCTLGTSTDVTRAAVESASIVLAQVNQQMPRVHGDGFIHIDEIDSYIEVDTPLPTLKDSLPSDIEIKIGENVASLVENGSTIQIGIGAVPDAVLGALKNHKNLGIHTETWSSGALNLLKTGVVDNSQKKVHRGKTVSSFIFGNAEVYKFIHDNPSIIQLETCYVNDPEIIARNPKVVAINSAVEVDLTGQICADSIGSRIISGVGGQMDFIRGAALSEGGKPIIALTSRTRKNTSRIVPTLKPGAGVVTTRAHTHFVVTEYGIADLYGKTLGERSRALIEIAHPEDRSSLESAWKNFLK